MSGYVRITKVLVISFAIILIASTIGIIFNVLNPNGIKITNEVLYKVKQDIKPPKKEIPVKTSRNVIVKKEMKEDISKGLKPVVVEQIDLLKAKELFDSEKAVFLDSRPEFRYLEGHIKGALSLSASRFFKQYDEVKDKIRKDSIIVVYCSGLECHLSDMVADKLKEMGYINLKVFAGGWPEWLEAGYPVEKGKNY